MLTLALEAATLSGSVAVIRDGEVLASREVAMRSGAEEHLLPAIGDALREAGATVRDLGRVVCGAGPGSFTSLRVSASLAKGLAFAQQIPLLAVPSLALIAADESLTDGAYLTVLDALRGDVSPRRTSASGTMSRSSHPCDSCRATRSRARRHRSTPQ